MSTFVLKIIAVATMLIDHIAAVFFTYGSPIWIICRSIGRLSFPIFAFLIAEGFHHTSNIKKYLTRLGIFALISEIPFDMAFYHDHYGSDFIKDFKLALSGSDIAQSDAFIKNLLSHQNIFFTLFLGLLAMYLMGMVEKKYSKQALAMNVLNALITLGFCVFAVILRADYDMIGILIIVAFYLFRGNKLLITISLLIACGPLFANGNITIQIFAALAMIPIAFYNGEKGKSFKYFFYAFYPVHLVLLFLIYTLI